MVKTSIRSILSPLTRSRILFSVLAVLAFGVVVTAQTVVRTNGGTQTATGTDVSTVQQADGYASGDVISVSGTSATSIAPFSASVRVEGSYTVDNFTVQSATSDKQYIGALPNSRNYVLKLSNKNYNLTFKNVEFQNNDIPQDTAGIFLIMDQATSTLTLNLDNASFTKFKGSKDGNYGGIINSSGDLTINGTNTVSFYGNGTGSGGAIFASKAVTINCDEMIFDNNACNNSGAIRNSGALNITGSKVTFSNNSARNNGGSIYSTSTITMTGSGDNSVLTFTGNTAANEGGVIYATGTGIDLDFDTINFSNNQATNFGGAIRFNNTNTNYKATITGETVTFDNNSALNKNGGAIHTNASVVLKGKSENSVFTLSNNTAPNGNSGFIVAVGSVEISTGSFIFQNNSAGGIAGAIEARKGITFSGDNTSATFTGNTAGTDGIDLYLSNANSVLTFQDSGTYYFDGGIFLADETQSTVIDKAQVTIAGRTDVTNNNYQLQTVNISNGGKLTANLDYIDSLTGTINVGTDESEGTLEFGVGEGLSQTLPLSDTFGVSFADKSVLSKSGAGVLKLPGDFTYNGKTNISDGTLEISNDFTPSVLTGSGTLNLTGAGKFFDSGDASGFTGTVQAFDDGISANSRINLAGNNGTESTNIDLSNATVELNGNPSGKYSELAFYKGSSSLSIGTLNGNKYGRILNVDSSTSAAYNDLIVSEGTYAGEIGRNENTYKYVNNINLIKVGDGTFTFSGLPYYFGETNIEDGVLKFVNDNASANKNFTSSSALKGSGTFEIVGNTNNWVVFALNADASSPQEFSGLLDVSGYMVFSKDTNLGNATLHVGANSITSMHGSGMKNLTVNELNTEAGSKVRISHASPGEGNFATLTVGSGTVNGDLGEIANNAWYNWVKLNKVSDGSDDGGTLTLAGAFLYIGETTISGGTLQLTGNAVSANSKMTVGDNGTLEYNVAEDQTKKLTISEQNAIASAGQIFKTGNGTLQFDAAENSIDAKSLTLSEGRLDFKGYMVGDITVNKGVFSPGNSVGTANVTGNVVITDDGTALFEFSSFDERLFDVLEIVNGTTENAFTAGASTIQLLFENEDAVDWAAALVDNPDGYQLVSDEGFATLGNLSSWLDNYTNLFGLEGRADGLYLVAAAAPEPGSGVPEPSTWALLLLGAAGLLYWRKRKN
ncbi:MAG: autotransporter-associated beta strand repeat-containing protein [Thermoguttaceae bacterium]|nr:autotransporter-associated beta strand repeat-containing protein [Thermoguttaceae bacterium]